jgi:NADPH:quinone reductase-like Zn-dependent oxidoreductase
MEQGKALQVLPARFSLLEAGTLKAQIQETYELDRAPEALQTLGGSHTRGKLAIRVA